MVRELARLYDATLELHNNMTMEIQVLSKENQDLRTSIGKDEKRYKIVNALKKPIEMFKMIHC